VTNVTKPTDTNSSKPAQTMEPGVAINMHHDSKTTSLTRYLDGIHVPYYPHASAVSKGHRNAFRSRHSSETPAKQGPGMCRSQMCELSSRLQC
jgi:hypothetical protein